MTTRVTSVAVEILTGPAIAQPRVTSLAVEILTAPFAPVRATSFAVEVLTANVGPPPLPPQTHANAVIVVMF